MGDPFEAIATQGQINNQLHVRSRRPADEAAWMMTKPYSFWGPADCGLTTKDWSAFPELGGLSLHAQLFPFGNTELVISFLTLIAAPARIRSFAKSGGDPPPPPAEGGS